MLEFTRIEGGKESKVCLSDKVNVISLVEKGEGCELVFESAAGIGMAEVKEPYKEIKEKLFGRIT